MDGRPSRGTVDLLLLGVLRLAPAHGYGLIVRLRERSDGAFDLAEGTIYPALHRLEDAGLVESSLAVEQGRQRRTYALTVKGRKELAARRRAWQHHVGTIQAVIA